MRKPKEAKGALYLDIDGVIIPFGTLNKTEFPFEMQALNKIECYSPEVVRRLGDLALKIVWCTTQSHNELLVLQKRINWPQNSRQLSLPEVTPGQSRITQKLDAIIADQANTPMPFVWIDDDITKKEQGKIAQRFAATPHLSIRTDRTIGISHQQFDEVEIFTRSISA